MCFAELEDGARPTALMELLGALERRRHQGDRPSCRRGLVRREIGSVDVDRRAVVVRVTRKGRSELRRALRGFEPHIAEFWTAMHWISEGTGAT